LETNSSEVMNMLITEWNLEETQRTQLAQDKDEGREERDRDGLIFSTITYQ